MVLRLLIGLILGFAIMTGATSAQNLPEEIAQPYVAYTEALNVNDIEAARGHALQAWQAAERLEFDGETTAILADNYAQIVSILGELSEAQRAYERAAALKEAAGADAEMMAEAWIFVANSALLGGETAEALRVADRAADIAETIDHDDGRHSQLVFTGRAIQAHALWLQGRIRTASMRAREALEIADNTELSDADRIGLMHFITGAMAALENEYEDAAYYLTGAYAYMADLRYPLGIWVSYVRENLNEGEAAQLLERITAAEFPDYSDAPIEEPEIEREYNGVFVDARPETRRPPRYPVDAARAGVEGVAVVRFSIDARGRAVDPEVVLSLPAREFGEEALKVLSRWRYEPATRDGQPVRRDGVITQFDFKLQD